jgi:ABC-2 type transport system ATP-binding protein
MKVEVKSVYKSFNSKFAIRDISFRIGEGEIFGLLGPNGAGKTTLIRMMMDILKPDGGEILVDGHLLRDKDKERIGYLPEERGLYKKQKVWEILAYFGILKGLSPSHAKERTFELLEKVEMTSEAKRKIEELSKGNQQKIQIIGTFIHDPEFVVLDEPFTGLDPINVRLIKNLVQQMKEAGKTIVLSTHLMHQVEELCSTVFMVNNGKNVLYGSLRDVKSRYSDDAILVDDALDLDRLDCVKRWENFGTKKRAYLNEGEDAYSFLDQLKKLNLVPTYFETASSPLEEIFIKIVESTKE